MRNRQSLYGLSLLLISLIVFTFLVTCSKDPTGPEDKDEFFYSDELFKLEGETKNNIVSMDTLGVITFSQQTSDGVYCSGQTY